jgi:hypothetical protein
MKAALFIFVILVLLFAGAFVGWKTREWKDSFDAEIDKIFYNALKENE